MPRTNAKDALADTMETLILKMDFDDITVDMLSSEAGYSRTTFYNHFTDKYQLLAWVYMRRCNTYQAQCLDSGDWRSLGLQCAELLSEMSPFFARALRYDGHESLVESLTKYALDFYDQLFAKHLSKEEIPSHLHDILTAYLYGWTKLHQHWVVSGTQPDPEYIAKVSFDLLPQIVITLLDKCKTGTPEALADS